jgi:putative transposase
MKQAGITIKISKKRHYDASGKQQSNIPNEIKRQFNPQQVTTHWFGDITFIRHHQRWSYLATLFDMS